MKRRRWLSLLAVSGTVGAGWLAGRFFGIIRPACWDRHEGEQPASPGTSEEVRQVNRAIAGKYFEKDYVRTVGITNREVYGTEQLVVSVGVKMSGWNKACKEIPETKNSVPIVIEHQREMHPA